MATLELKGGETTNGAAMAAFLAAGIGAFAIGFIVILNSTGLFSIPALYGPAGGVSGRTTLATLIWLIGWITLHLRWRDRQVDSQRILAGCLILIGFAILFTFPPFWGLL